MKYFDIVVSLVFPPLKTDGQKLCPASPAGIDKAGLSRCYTRFVVNCTGVGVARYSEVSPRSGRSKHLLLFWSSFGSVARLQTNTFAHCSVNLS